MTRLPLEVPLDEQSEGIFFPHFKVVCLCFTQTVRYLLLFSGFSWFVHNSAKLESAQPLLRDTAEFIQLTCEFSRCRGRFERAWLL